MTNRVPTQNASPKTEKFSARSYCVCFSFQIKQNLDLSSGATCVTLEYAISSLSAVPMATEAKAGAPICYVALGGAEQASAPNMDWQVQHLYYTYEGLWERQHLPHMCTSRTAGTKPTYAQRILVHRSVLPTERKDRAGEQLFYTAWCLLQYAIFSWKSARLFQLWKMGDQPFTFSLTGESTPGSKRGSAPEQTCWE